MPHSIWTDDELNNVEITHTKYETMVDSFAYFSVFVLRTGWDISTGYTFGRKLGWIKFGETNWVKRITFLETVAGVPGMMFAM